MGVNLRFRNIGMPQHHLDTAQIRSPLEQMRGEAVTQGVGRYPVKKPDLPAIPGQELPEGLPRQAAATGGDKEVAAGPPVQEGGSPGSQVVRQRPQSLLANRYEALLVPLAGSAHDAHFEVKIAHPQPAQLRYAKTAGIQGCNIA